MSGLLDTLYPAQHLKDQIIHKDFQNTPVHYLMLPQTFRLVST